VIVIGLGAEKTDHEHDYEHEGQVFVRCLLFVPRSIIFPFSPTEICATTLLLLP
jgi:hypothetical protein